MAKLAQDKDRLKFSIPMLTKNAVAQDLDLSTAGSVALHDQDAFTISSTEGASRFMTDESSTFPSGKAYSIVVSPGAPADFVWDSQSASPTLGETTGYLHWDAHSSGETATLLIYRS